MDVGIEQIRSRQTDSPFSFQPENRRFVSQSRAPMSGAHICPQEES